MSAKIIDRSAVVMAAVMRLKAFASPAPLSRAQVLRSELAAALSRSLAETTHQDSDDPDVRLAAELTIALWSSSAL